jgi:hypothetical protein
MSNLDQPETHEEAYNCVSVDLNVNDMLYEQVVELGQEVAGDRDFFEVGVRHILRDTHLGGKILDLKKSVDKSE